MAGRLEWEELGGTRYKGGKGGFGRKSEVLHRRGRAWDPRAILFISFQSSAFAGQIPMPLPNLTTWNRREEGDKQKEVFPHHPSPPTLTLPAQQRFGILCCHSVMRYCIMYSIMCSSLRVRCCTSFPCCCTAQLYLDGK